MNFSERIGISKPNITIQASGMNDTLRNSLWNVLHMFIFDQPYFLYDTHGDTGNISVFSAKLWFGLFKKPIDTIPNHPSAALQEIRKYFFECRWYRAYEFIEFVIETQKDAELELFINNVLETELSGYRLIENKFVPVTEKIEVDAIKKAILELPFAGVSAHLKQAMNHLSRHESPDYRNSIKESISAVECMAREVSGNQKATLGDALSVLEKNGKLHPALKKGFSAIYGYSNDEGGIRHAMLDEPNLSVNDAKFFLVVCASFINYLKTKL